MGKSDTILQLHKQLSFQRNERDSVNFICGLAVGKNWKMKKENSVLDQILFWTLYRGKPNYSNQIDMVWLQKWNSKWYLKAHVAWEVLCATLSISCVTIWWSLLCNLICDSGSLVKTFLFWPSLSSLDAFKWCLVLSVD